MSKQFICYLNGVSSSGKTSLAKEFMKIVKEPTIYLSLDNIHENLCDRYSNENWELYTKECYGLHRTAVVWKELGFNVLIDNVVENEDVASDAKKILTDAIYIGLIIPLEILLEREEKRGRKKNFIKFQYKRVHSYFKYDLELNSHKNTSVKMSNEILKFLKR